MKEYTLSRFPTLDFCLRLSTLGGGAQAVHETQCLVDGQDRLRLSFRTALNPTENDMIMIGFYRRLNDVKVKGYSFFSVKDR